MLKQIVDLRPLILTTMPHRGLQRAYVTKAIKGEYWKREECDIHS